MPTRPVSRYFNYGLTFRWTQGDREIAVKRGYVLEGSPFIEVTRPRHFTITDRPNEDPANDRAAWIAAIPVNPSDWDKPGFLAKAAEAWATANPRTADLNDRTDRRADGPVRR